MALRKPEPGSFEERLVETTVSASRLVRLSRFPASEPYWSSAVYRFDDPAPGRPDSFGMTYVATQITVAFAETVLHNDISASDDYTITQIRAWAFFAAARRPARGRSGAAGDPPGGSVAVFRGRGAPSNQLWSRAIHDSDERWDGIRYVSRQRNDAYAYAIFERSGLRVKATTPLAGAELSSLCDQYNVVEI